MARALTALLALAALLALTAGATGCASDEGPAVQVPPPPPGALTPELMYSLEAIPTFELTLDDKAQAALADAPKTYVRGEFRYDDTLMGDVGIRLKGNFTLTTLAEKPSFKVKFNAFTPGRRFIGLEGLTLHNMHSDASMVREWLSYKIFREIGVPAPRTGYAWVVVNGEQYGLYLNIEPYNDDFLTHNFADPTGNLYEGNYGDDLDSDVTRFELDEGTDTSREGLHRLAELALQPGDAVFYAPESPLDTDEVLSYIAGEAFIGHFDGYRLPHNYFIYHEPTLDKFAYMPWSLDQAMLRHVDPFAGKGFLTRKCIDEVPDCRRDYVLRALGVVDAVEALDLQGELDRVIGTIDGLSRTDTRKRHTNGSMEGDRNGVRGFLSSRPAEMRTALDCLVDGVEPDDDNDGYGVCALDCADDDPAIHPGATEVCDGVDNDCSGEADDVPACECPSEVVEGRRYYFCPYVRTWVEGRDFCQAQGHGLARIESAEQNAGVWAIAHATRGGHWAIGLNDRGTEDEYLWGDGTAATFTAWGDGEPAKLLPWFDCVFFTGHDAAIWKERNCIEPAAFICSDQ